MTDYQHGVSAPGPVRCAPTAGWADGMRRGHQSGGHRRACQATSCEEGLGGAGAQPQRAVFFTSVDPDELL